MSTTSSPLFTETKGSIGELIIYTVKKKVRIRSKPAQYKDKKSKKQVAQRSSMKGTIRLYQMLDWAFMPSWRERTKDMDMSGYNLFIKENIKNVVSEDCLVDPALLKISVGDLPIPKKFTLSKEENGDFVLCWDLDGENIDCMHYDDQLQIGVYGRDADNKEMEISYLKNVIPYRSACQCRFQLPEDKEGTLHLYACFKCPYTNEYSDSVYLGSLEAAP